MKINIRDLLTLDNDKEYLVGGKVNYQNKIYYCLLDIKNPANYMFCVQKNDELVKVTDEELLSKLLPYLALSSLKDTNNE